MDEVKNEPSPNARIIPLYRWRLTFWLRLITWGLLAATLAGRLGNAFFLFDLFSHFAVQYAVLSALLAIFWLYNRPRLLAGIPALTLLLNGALILPWLTAPKPGGNSRRDLRLLHANVLFTGSDYPALTRLVQSQTPDLFVLQEMTPASIRGVSALKKAFPYQYHIWSKGPCHILVGSRTPIQIDSALAYPARVVSLRTVVRGHQIALMTVHPPVPLLPAMFADRNRQLALVTGKARREQLPAIVLGDFNISVFSPVYRRLVDKEGLAACRWGFGLQPTWPRFLPLMFIPIDHAFVNGGFRTINLQTLDQVGSDHKAVVVDLAFANPASTSVVKKTKKGNSSG